MRAALGNELEGWSDVLVLQRGPNADDAEQATLSAMLMDGQAIVAACQILQAADFSRGEHRAMFAAISRLANEGVVVDPITLADDLARHGELKAAGGKDYIGYLIDAVPIATSVMTHAGIVLCESKRRAAVELLEHSIGRLRRGEEDAAQVALRLRPALDVLAIGRRRLIGFVDDMEIVQLPNLSFVIDGLIPAGGLTTLYGAPESGKSLFALHVAFAVASGQQCFGRAVARGDVVYVAAEGVSGIPARVEALRERYGYQGQQGVHFMLQPINLMKVAEVTQLIETVHAAGWKPKLFVFDTLSRCMLGGDENSAQDMGAVLTSCGRLQQEFGASVLPLHHPGKSGDVERGNSALRGGSDAMVFAKKEGNVHVFAVNKMKNGSRGTPLRLCIEAAAPSVVLAAIGGVAHSPLNDALAREQRALRAPASNVMPGGATATQWERAANMKEREFYRVVKHLVAAGLVAAPVETRGKYTLTDKGQSEITACCAATAP